MRTSPARISLTVLVFVTLLAGLSCVALAAGGDPQTRVTGNIVFTGPGTTVTEMEQRLLHRRGHLFAQSGLHSAVMRRSLSH